jgi:serine/threonine protein kinase
LAILRQIAEAKQRPLRELNPQTPQWLADTIDQLLAKKPNDRIQTAAQLAELLERFRRSAKSNSASRKSATAGLPLGSARRF